MIDPQDELICLGHDEDVAESQLGGLAPPIVQTSLFGFPSLGALQAGLAEEFGHHVYTRGQNPTVEAVETKLAALERGESCKLSASGMAAVSSVLYALLKAGDHVLFVNQIYGPTLQLARHMQRFEVEHDVVLDLETNAIVGALRPNTRLVWMECPGTMLVRTFDVEAVAAAARERGILTALDNSWASPLFQKPLTLGVDVVVHSATKYIGGHSDVLAGAVITQRELLRTIFKKGYLLGGGALGPFDAWLLNRGLRTLPVRMRQHHAGGLAVARHLASHPRVRRVFHPGLAETPPKTLNGFSGLLSLELDTERHEDVARFVDALRYFKIGVSWGGVESLVIAPFNGKNARSLERNGLPLGLVRLSIGLEGASVLTGDLDEALATLP